MTYRSRPAITELLLCIALTICTGCRILPSAGQAPPKLHHYFGNTHSHTSFSDGKGTPAELIELAQKTGLDFYAITDHALTKYPGYTPANYEFTRHEADRLTTSRFVVIPGFEYSENDGPGAKGHANVLNAASTLNATGPNCDYPRFFDWLTHDQPQPVVASFNHAGPATYNAWDFGTDLRPDNVALFEIINSGKPREPGFYTALDHGWRVAPVAAMDNHGPWRITEADYRTGVLAPELTRDALIQAMLDRHVYATWGKNLRVTCFVNGVLTGAVLPKTDSLDWTISVQDPDTDVPTDRITHIKILGPQGVVVTEHDFDKHSVHWKTQTPADLPCYFVTVYTADKTDAPTAYSSPVWLK
jgi:hypothetical protein